MVVVVAIEINDVLLLLVFCGLNTRLQQHYRHLLLQSVESGHLDVFCLFVFCFLIDFIDKTQSKYINEQNIMSGGLV